MNKIIEEIVKQIKENWRLVLVAVIVVAISISSFQNEKKAEQKDQPEQSSQAEQNNNANPENTANAENTENTEEKKPEDTAVSNDSDQNSTTQIVKKGEGMTHLARRAIKGYLARSGKALTSEQKIYAEDYVRKNTPSQKIITGQSITFSEEVINTAVEKATALTEKQIKNLEKFVPLVKNL